MTPQALKSSILQRAVEGKLVEQRIEEGTGEELYRQICSERQQLIKKGKIKREKLPTEILENEYPFEIPETWKWVKLGTLVSVLGGKRIPAGRKLTTEDTGHTYIRVSDMKNGSVLCDNLLYVPEDIYQSISKYVINSEDVYITVAGTIGRVGRIPKKLNGANLTENADRLVLSIIDQEWLIKWLESALVQQQIIAATTQVGQPKLAIKRIQELVIPLPPLKEQKRIVAKIEEILPLIDRYGKAWEKLEAFNKKFPEDMQKSILQMAIQGKLVEQRQEEGTGEELYQQIQSDKQLLIKSGKIKKEKPLPEISEDEIQFDTPQNWKVVRLGDVANKITDGTHKTPKYTSDGIPFVSAKNLKSGFLNFSDCKYITQEEHKELFQRCNPEKGDILISKSGSIGTVSQVSVDFEFSMFESLALVKSNPDYLDPDYLKYALQDACFHLTSDSIRGVAVKHLPIADIKRLVIPLPPYEEQKRIVIKLKEILPLCTCLN